MTRLGTFAATAGHGFAPLELTGLSRVFPTPSGPFIAVKDVNATIEAGEFVTILGHSGCGKSTVLSIVAGLDRATLGGVIIDGKEVTGPGPERAIVFQAPCLLPWLSARQNVQLPGTGPTVSPRGRARSRHLSRARRDRRRGRSAAVATFARHTAVRLAGAGPGSGAALPAAG